MITRCTSFVSITSVCAHIISPVDAEKKHDDTRGVTTEPDLGDEGEGEDDGGDLSTPTNSDIDDEPVVVSAKPKPRALLLKVFPVFALSDLPWSFSSTSQE